MESSFCVNKKQLVFLIEIASHEFVVDSSDLELPINQWPKIIDCGMCFGNGQPLIRVSRNSGEEIKYVNYKQANGCIKVKIFNT